MVGAKVIVLGDDGVGKTTLVIKFARGYVSDLFHPYVYEQCLVDVRTVDMKQNVEFIIWDLPGSEEFRRIRHLSYPDVNVAILCFSVDSPESLENALEMWLMELTEHCPDAPIILLGCKVELRHDIDVVDTLNQTRAQSPVSTAEGLAAASLMGAKEYMECSARLGTGVEAVLQQAARLALATHEERRSHFPQTCTIT